MANIYHIDNHTGLIPLKETDLPKIKKESSALSVEIYTIEEFVQVDLGDDDVEEAIALLSHSSGAFVNSLPDCFIGSLSFPNRSEGAIHSVHFGFYLNPQRLIFIDDSKTTCKQALESLSDLEKLPKISTGRILFELMKHFIEDDTIFLTEIEKQLGETEDLIIDHHAQVTNQELLAFRQKLLKYDRIYQQLTDLSNIISKDEYLVLGKDDHRLFRLFSQRTERLFQRAQYLKEYSLQLRELYQMQIDVQQNKTIQWLTVITTLVVPLTLITSWYGMNFKNMPELEWPYAYFIIIGICVALVIVQLIFFKKRKWL